MKLVIQPAQHPAPTTQQVVNAFTMTCALTQFILQQRRPLSLCAAKGLEGELLFSQLADDGDRQKVVKMVCANTNTIGLHTLNPFCDEYISTILRSNFYVYSLYSTAKYNLHHHSSNFSSFYQCFGHIVSP
jgi:hypothetical protein